MSVARDATTAAKIIAEISNFVKDHYYCAV